VAFRLLYLIAIRVIGWLLLLGGSLWGARSLPGL
jgi:hypothetical protein